MKNWLKKAVTTMLIIGSLSSFSGCQMQVSDIPTKVIDGYNESVNDEQIEDDLVYEVVDGAVQDGVSKDDTTQSDIAHDDTEIKSEIDIDAEVAKYYSNYEQVGKISESLGAKSDILYRLAYDCMSNKNTIRRLEHNLGESIKIAIHPSMSERAAEIAIEQSDLLFSIVGGINSNYRYEVVEYSDDGKYDILFQNRDGHLNGLVDYTESDYHQGTAYNKASIVYINERAINGSCYNTDLQLKYVTLHELLHVFGFGDVYLVDTHEIDGTTIMEGSTRFDNEFAVTNITPNDFKNLIALYAPPTDNLEKDIVKYQEMIEEYTQTYYEHWTAENFRNQKISTKTIEDGVYTFSRKVYIDKSNKIFEEVEFTIEIKGDRYGFVVTKNDGSVLEQTSGDVRFLSTFSETTGRSIDNSVAIFEGLDSRFIHEDIFRSEEISGAFTDIVMYYDGEKMIFKDTLGNINRAAPEFQNEIEKQFNS